MDQSDLLHYSEDDYTTFVREYDKTTFAERIAFFGAVKARQMEFRLSTETCEVCREWVEPDEIDRFNGHCMECYHNLPSDCETDPKRGSAAYINRRT